MSSPPGLSGICVARSFSVWCFVDRCLFFCSFSFGHCVVCPSSIYGFWFPQELMIGTTMSGISNIGLTERYILWSGFRYDNTIPVFMYSVQWALFVSFSIRITFKQHLNIIITAYLHNLHVNICQQYRASFQLQVVPLIRRTDTQTNAVQSYSLTSESLGLATRILITPLVSSNSSCVELNMWLIMWFPQISHATTCQ
jgi:hypothetical protein